MNEFIEIKEIEYEKFSIGCCEINQIYGLHSFFKSATKSGYPIFSISVNQSSTLSINIRSKAKKNDLWANSGMPEELKGELMEMISIMKGRK